jgi:hypothetical protein
MLKAEDRLRVLQNRVLRRIFGPKRDEITGDWKKLLGEEPHNLYFSSNIIRMIKSRRTIFAWHAVCMGDMSNAYKNLVGKSEGKMGG